MLVVMMMVMRVVMVVMSGLRPFVSTLRQTRCHSTIVDLRLSSFCIFPSATVFLPSSTDL